MTPGAASDYPCQPFKKKIPEILRRRARPIFLFLRHAMASRLLGTFAPTHCSFVLHMFLISVTLFPCNKCTRTHPPQSMQHFLSGLYLLHASRHPFIVEQRKMKHIEMTTTVWRYVRPLSSRPSTCDWMIRNPRNFNVHTHTHTDIKNCRQCVHLKKFKV